MGAVDAGRTHLRSMAPEHQAVWACKSGKDFRDIAGAGDAARRDRPAIRGDNVSTPPARGKDVGSGKAYGSRVRNA